VAECGNDRRRWIADISTVVGQRRPRLALSSPNNTRTSAMAPKQRQLLNWVFTGEVACLGLTPGGQTCTWWLAECLHRIATGRTSFITHSNGET
jgi:hypothetical protein